MSNEMQFAIEEVPPSKRDQLLPILEGSFEGWYLWHSRKTMKEIETVRAARVEKEWVGLAMLKMLEASQGYVYYIAVLPAWRGKKVGGRLLEDALQYFSQKGANQVYAGISEDNVESERLFESHSFQEISFAELSQSFGRLHAINMYRKMVIVAGEVVYRRLLTETLD